MNFLLLIGFFFIPKLAYTAEVKKNNIKSDSQSYQNIQNFDDRQFREESLYCSDLNPQNTIDLKMLYGPWYGAEIITHHEADSYHETTYDSCVHVNIGNREQMGYGFVDGYDTGTDYDYANFDERKFNHGSGSYDRKNLMHNSGMGDQRLHLSWAERGRNLHYSLRVARGKPGLWITTSNQRGSMTQLTNYHQFDGTIQVIKAVGNHLVLTFCEMLPKSNLFTVVLTKRLHDLSRDEIQSIRSLLRRRGLNVQSVRKVCRNSASMNSLSFVTIMIFFVLSMLSQKV